ncbi:hypothetical protein CBR_g66784 [Chara braunii]|uniref:Uncharacterized protein n=1 Tax=Chara braunii TaxID=69332 RepID=A0A388K9B8_CHABU|nr:hypothetical protein CBR_g66784 [Chara braunii]|eukprot:GBG66648.1 hypothetical protein CBR_g66784 [Chara braunii]
MKERLRWQPEEDNLLRLYVKQYGPQDWGLIQERMGKPLARDAKSCQQRWKNYLRPGLKKGPLSDDEKQRVIVLQAKYGNKWKKIAAEVPGRTARRLNKWWDVYMAQLEAKQQQANAAKVSQAFDQPYHSSILSRYAEKRGCNWEHLPLSTPPTSSSLPHNPYLMALSSNGVLVPSCFLASSFSRPRSEVCNAEQLSSTAPAVLQFSTPQTSGDKSSTNAALRDDQCPNQRTELLPLMSSSPGADSSSHGGTGAVPCHLSVSPPTSEPDSVRSAVNPRAGVITPGPSSLPSWIPSISSPAKGTEGDGADLQQPAPTAGRDRNRLPAVVDAQDRGCLETHYPAPSTPVSSPASPIPAWMSSSGASSSTSTAPGPTLPLTLSLASPQTPSSRAPPASRCQYASSFQPLAKPLDQGSDQERGHGEGQDNQNQGQDQSPSTQTANSKSLGGGGSCSPASKEGGSTSTPDMANGDHRLSANRLRHDDCHEHSHRHNLQQLQHQVGSLLPQHEHHQTGTSQLTSPPSNSATLGALFCGPPCIPCPNGIGIGIQLGSSAGVRLPAAGACMPGTPQCWHGAGVKPGEGSNAETFMNPEATSQICHGLVQDLGRIKEELFNHKKEMEWKLKRLEQQFESEKIQKKKQRLEQVEAQIRALRDEANRYFEEVDKRYHQEFMDLKREDERKEMQLLERWDLKHREIVWFSGQQLPAAGQRSSLESSEHIAANDVEGGACEASALRVAGMQGAPGMGGPEGGDAGITAFHDCTS